MAYAGKDDDGRNYVGEIYFNFRKVERHLPAVKAFVQAVIVKLGDSELLGSFDTVIGIPNGGRTFGQDLASMLCKRFAYPEKKAKPTQQGMKQEYEWDLSQFEFEPRERVAVVEDIFNNFQNTDSTLEQIAATGAEVVLLAGALNRSPIYRELYTPKKGVFAGKPLPVIASISQPYPEYKQDDPEVVGDVQAGRVEFEVKKNWAQLQRLMGS